MNIMGCRLRWLELVYAGLQKSGIPFLAYDQHYLPFTGHDDLGIYYYLPPLMNFFSWSAHQAFTYFFAVLMMVSMMSGLLAFSIIFRSYWLRILLVLWLIPVTALAWHIGDVYIAYYSSVVGLVPWAMYYLHEQAAKKDYAVAVWSGLCAGFLHTIRAHAALGAVGALLIALLMSKRPWRMKGALLALLALGFCVPNAWISQVYSSYQQKVAAYTKAPADSYHPLWHTIYVGFGLLRILNTHDISFSDTCGADRGALSGVTYGTPAYESCMKREVFTLCQRSPLFVLLTLWAKIGILLFFFLVFANVGLLAAFWSTRSDWLALAPLGISLALNALFPLIAVPYFSYTMGFITTSALCGLYIIAHAVTRKNQYA